MAAAESVGKFDSRGKRSDRLQTPRTSNVCVLARLHKTFPLSNFLSVQPQRRQCRRARGTQPGQRRSRIRGIDRVTDASYRRPPLAGPHHRARR